MSSRALAGDVVKCQTQPAEIELARGVEDAVGEIPDFIKVAAAIFPRAFFGALPIVLLIGLNRGIQRHTKELLIGFRVLKRVHIGRRDCPTADRVNPDLPVSISLRNERTMVLNFRACMR